MASFGNFWNGAVAKFKVLCIFVLAWCWVFATFLSRETLCATYFPNLRRKLLSYFSERLFFKFLPKNLAWQLKTEPNFVDNFCTEITFSGKSVVKLKTETKLCVKICFAWQSKLCRKTLRWFFLSSENIMQHTTAV